MDTSSPPSPASAPPPSSAPSSRLHYGWIILAMGLVTVFSALGLARFGYTLILPPMQQGLGLSNTQAGALATGNLIGYLCLALIGGALASRFSPRRVITVSAFVVGATMLLTATAGDFFSALVWRTLTGMGSGGSNVPVMGLMAAWFARKRRGLATGVAVAGSSLALIVTGPLIPRLLSTSETGGWRLSWAVLGGLGIGVSVLCHFILRDRPADVGLRPIGEADASDASAAQPTTPELVVNPLSVSAAAPSHGAVQVAPGYVSPLSRSGPGSWHGVYRTAAIWHLALIYTTFGFSYIIFVTFFARYLQAEQGYTKEAAGRLWLVIGWLSIFCGVIWGWVSDTLGRKYGLALVCFLQGTTYAVFALWGSRAGVLTTVVLFGITAWSIPAIMAAACGDHLGPKLAPAALGLITLFFGIGQAAGPLVAGRMADSAGTFVPALLLAAGVAAAGGVASLFLHRTH